MHIYNSYAHHQKINPLQYHLDAIPSSKDTISSMNNSNENNKAAKNDGEYVHKQKQRITSTLNAF